MHASFHIGPKFTPSIIKILIWITCGISILSPITTFFLHHFFSLPGPNEFLILSSWGIKHGFFWQAITYLFVQTFDTTISLSLLLSLLFLMLLLWISGSELVFRFGPLSFVCFYLGAGLTAGIISIILASISSTTMFLAGSDPAVYAALLGWAMLYPELEFYLFFLVRVKAKWLVTIILAFSFLRHLSSGNWISFVALLIGVLWGYLFATLFWKLQTPFSFTHPIDHFLNNLFKRRP